MRIIFPLRYYAVISVWKVSERHLKMSTIKPVLNHTCSITWVATIRSWSQFHIENTLFQLKCYEILTVHRARWLLKSSSCTKTNKHHISYSFVPYVVFVLCNFPIESFADHWNGAQFKIATSVNSLPLVVLTDCLYVLRWRFFPKNQNKTRRVFVLSYLLCAVYVFNLFVYRPDKACILFKFCCTFSPVAAVETTINESKTNPN